MFPALIALCLASPALAQDPEPAASKPADPDVVLAVGPYLAMSAALFESEILGIDPMLGVSLEIKFDRSISGRLEVGGSPFRGRLHVGLAGRAYPNGRSKSAWYGEASFHVQRTGAKVRTDEWEPRPGRGWFSLPLHAGGGWRFVLADGLVVDLGGSIGPTVEIRPDAEFVLAFGLAGQAGVFFGYGF